MDWDTFCKLLHTRFGRDHHELLIKQLLSAKQVGSVDDYIEKFSQLIDDLSAYAAVHDPLYFVMRFIDVMRILKQLCQFSVLLL